MPPPLVCSAFSGKFTEIHRSFFRQGKAGQKQEVQGAIGGKFTPERADLRNTSSIHVVLSHCVAIPPCSPMAS